METYNNSVTSDGSGGAIIAGLYGGGGGMVNVQRVDSTGALQWGVNGYNFGTTSAGADEFPVVAGDNLGGAIMAWPGKNASSQYDIYAQGIFDSAAVPSCVPGAVAGETCASVSVGCNTGGAISISGISVTAPFETRTPEFYNDLTDAPLTSAIYLEITDTRGYDPNPPSCGVASTISVQSDGLVNGSDTLAVGLGTAIIPADWSCQGACSPANLSILSSNSAVGPILTGTDILSLSEAFGGAFRLNLDDDNLEILRPAGPVGTGTYGGNITFTLT